MESLICPRWPTFLTTVSPGKAIELSSAAMNPGVPDPCTDFSSASLLGPQGTAVCLHSHTLTKDQCCARDPGPATRSSPLSPNVKPGSPVQLSPSSMVSFPLGSLEFFPSKGPQLGEHQSIREVLVKNEPKKRKGLESCSLSSQEVPWLLCQQSTVHTKGY